MKLHIYDPPPRHDYLTAMFLGPLRSYAASRAVEISESDSLADARGVVLTLADNLTPTAITLLKDRGCKIIGFNVTDSSYVAQACRDGEWLRHVDLMFMVSGVQRINYGYELKIGPNFEFELSRREFLPEKDWQVFDAMRRQNRLLSLPYPHWTRQPHVDPLPYHLRSQKAVTRGGAHTRRFLLALQLMRIGKLDANSAFMTSAYFSDHMNPQFRYCDECRRKFDGRYRYEPPITHGECNSPAAWGNGSLAMDNLSAWNNRCPKSFYWLAEQFNRRYGGIDMGQVEAMMNGRWISQGEHLGILARMLFTTDLKWIFSIYAPQRFWDAAMTGCINLLPSCTMDQDYFPPMLAGVHYATYMEDMKLLDKEVDIDEVHYAEIAREARKLYDDYMRPTEYPINTALLRHMFHHIELAA